MPKSFKTVVHRAFLDEGCLKSGMPVRRIAQYFRTHFSKEINRFDVVETRVEDIAHCAGDILVQSVLENSVHA